MIHINLVTIIIKYKIFCIKKNSNCRVPMDAALRHCEAARSCVDMAFSRPAAWQPGRANWPSDRAAPWSAVRSQRRGRLPRRERTCFLVYKADGKAIRLTSSFHFALAGEVRSGIWLVLKTIHWLLTLGK
jgi:hypothetical protein